MASGSGQTRLGALAQDHELWFDTRRTDTACAACNYGEHRRKLTAPPSARSRRHTAPLTPALLRRQQALQLETLETPVRTVGLPGPAQVEGHARGRCAPVGARCGPHLHTRLATFPRPRSRGHVLAHASTTPGARSVAPNDSPPVFAPTPTPPPAPSVCAPNLSMAPPPSGAGARRPSLSLIHI